VWTSHGNSSDIKIVVGIASSITISINSSAI
jgi:hypothetical protein